MSTKPNSSSKSSTPVPREVLASLGYVKQFTGSTIVVKLGGSILQDDGLLSQICEDIALVRAVGVKVVLVHGGGPAINEELTRKAITWEFVEGLRVTTPEMMSVIETVLSGNVNRRIVRGLNRVILNLIKSLPGIVLRSLFNQWMMMVNQLETHFLLNTKYLKSLRKCHKKWPLNLIT